MILYAIELAITPAIVITVSKSQEPKVYQKTISPLSAPSYGIIFPTTSKPYQPKLPSKKQ